LIVSSFREISQWRRLKENIVDGIKDIEPVRNDQHLPQQLQDLAKPLAEIALVLIGLSYLAGFL